MKDRYRVKKILLLFILMVFGAPALHALGLPQIHIQNLRSKGMGGVKLSIYDDQYAVMNNPAGTAILDTAWVSLIQAQIVASGDFLGLFDHIDEFTAMAEAGSDEISNATWNYFSRLRFSAGTTPLYLSLLNVLPLNLNLAVFDSFNVRIKSNPDIPIPSWDFLAYNDAAVVLNWAAEILYLKDPGMGLFVGVNAKLIHRVQAEKDAMDIFYLASLGTSSLAGMDVRRGLGFGMDLGLAVVFGDDRALTLSLTLADFFGTRFAWTVPTKKDSIKDILFGDGDDVGANSIDPSFCFGLAWRAGTILPVVLEDILFAVDIRDMFDGGSTTFLKIYAGFEFSMLWILKIRGGIYQGYLSGGVGIDIPVLPLEIDFAYWGEELGLYPGQDRLDNFGVTLNIVF